MIGWLKRETVKVRLGEEREVAILRAHVLVALLVALAIGLVIGFGTGHYAYPYRTLPRPPLPKGQVAPKASSPTCGGTKHALGGCLPAPVHPGKAGDPAIQGPDLSNNDPLDCPHLILVARANSFVVLKVNQGTYYIDRTAGPMAACAAARHLISGGYDFLDFCAASPQAEAALFVKQLAIDHLLGPGHLPPTGDAEWPTGALSCNARSWLMSWIYAVHGATGVWPEIYTGAWWWQPHIGCFWPSSGTIAWISGYGVRYPYMPCGRSHLDLWQFSDHAWNGASTSDMSVWLDGAAAFAAVTSSRPPAPSCGIFPTARFELARGVRASECNTVRAWDAAKCRNPARRPVCTSSNLHLRLLRDREWFVARHRLTVHGWVTLRSPRWSYTSSQPLGARFQGISRRLSQR